MTQKKSRKMLAWIIALMAVCAILTGCEEGYLSRSQLIDSDQTEQSQPSQAPSSSNPDAGVM